MLHVVEHDQSSHLIKRQCETAYDHLDATVETIGVTDGVPANFAVTVGEIAREIDLAERTGSSLIVMGPHRRQFSDLFAGTVADHTIRLSRYPMLLANALPSPAVPTEPAGDRLR